MNTKFWHFSSPHNFSGTKSRHEMMVMNLWWGTGKTQGRCPRVQPHSALPNRASASPYSQVLARNGILLGGKESRGPTVTFPQFKPAVLPCGLKIPSVMECWLSLGVYYIIICVGYCGLYVNGRVNATVCVHWRPETTLGVCLYHSTPHYLRQGHHWIWDLLFQLGWLAGKT